MLIFIDESGIHKSIDHSVIALVYVCVDDLGHLEEKIKKIESDLGIENFHWSDFGSKRGWQIRKDFLRRTSELNFTLKVAVMEDPVDLPADFENCLEHLIIEKKITKIIIDGEKPKWYERRFKKVLRDKGVSVKKMRMLNDESSPGLRLVDALAGLIRSYYDKPTAETKALFRLFEKKITAQLVGGQMAR
jgi:hypothetical protein